MIALQRYQVLLFQLKLVLALCFDLFTEEFHGLQASTEVVALLQQQSLLADLLSLFLIERLLQFLYVINGAYEGRFGYCRYASLTLSLPFAGRSKIASAPSVHLCAPSAIPLFFP